MEWPLHMQKKYNLTKPNLLQKYVLLHVMLIFLSRNGNKQLTNPRFCTALVKLLSQIPRKRMLNQMPEKAMEKNPVTLKGL